MSKGKKRAKSTKEELPRRFGPQDRQEAESKADFAKCLAKLGWNALEPARDLGEDFLVQIYDEGVSSGLSFYVQLKSIRDAEKRKSKHAPKELRYRLEVKDIEHWEVQSPPVVLFVWDLDKQAGVWQAIPRIVEALEKEGKKWREKQSVTVRLPVENGTDEEGMRRLRYDVAEFMLPLFNARGSMIVKMTMTKAASDELIAALDRGKGMTLRNESTPNIEWPMWYRRLLGPRKKATEVQIGPVHSASEGVVLRVEVRVGKAMTAIPHVDLRPIGTGIKHIYLSNEHQRHPLVFSIEGEVGADTLQFKFRRKEFGRSIQEAREITEFVYLANQPGGHIRIIDANSGKVVVERPTYSNNLESMKILEKRRDIMEKLVEIEPFISKFGVFDLTNGLGSDDVETIEILYQAVKTGRVESTRKLPFNISPDTLELPAEGPITTHGVYAMNLLGLKVHVEAIETIVDSDEFLFKVRAAYDEARRTQKSIRVEFDNLRIVKEFLILSPPNVRLQDLAATQSGYFTIAQALESGFTSANQLEIHERVERCADGVYRFILHPPSEREDLVVTWLQTEKQGVFSHDTALALHELSDILPVRQHVTVPPEWKPVEGLPLSPNTVVHHGKVEPTEMTWMGPVPFTKPLRTVVDCIDDNLPPDLLDQALSDAYRRGMLSPAELHALQARKAKSA